MNVLLDKEFLKELDNFSNKEVYARVTALTNNELPIEMIEGRITGGNINIDGTSAIRRTCSLSLIAQDIDINEFYWGLNNKIKLEIGLKNFINPDYPDIIWFQQGVYVITEFNTSMSSNNYSISINGQDKMCLLNGTIGGSLPASIDFGVEEIYENDTVIYNKIPIDRIVREMLHAYALEPYHNIIINDLDEKALELLEYRGDTPLYLLYDKNNGEYTGIEFNGERECYLQNGKSVKLNSKDIVYNKRVDELLFDDATLIKLEANGEKNYYVTKIEFGQTVGYRLTELTYAGDLISGIGESITSVLDKITNMLGDFEYFYDLDGRFIFQRKKTYINTSWSPVIETDEDLYVENSAYINKNIYYFNGNNLISSFSNNPDLKNIRNDYSIWGTRKGVTGAELPIHFRYAIHKKPVYYKAFDETVYTDKDYNWRELIYQMAVDYYEHNQEHNFYSILAQNNPGYYPGGITGYEQFYIDILGFWRQLYDPSPSPSYYEYTYDSTSEKSFSAIDENNKTITLFTKDKYKQLSANDTNINKNDVYVLDTYNGKKQLQKFVDTIEVNYSFDANGKQDKYYITADGNDYKAINSSFYTRIEKKEIYVRDENNKWKSILDTKPLNNKCYLKEKNENNEYFLISSLPKDIQSLYYENGKYNKYYTISQLGIDGKPIQDADETYNYFTYYVEKYDYYKLEGSFNPEVTYWNANIKENPDTLNFWIDFLETEGSELEAFSISTIGDRPKVVNDNKVKSIYYRNVPNLILTTKINEDFLEKTGYIFMQVSDDIFNYFTISAQGKSAKNALDELLYNHSYCTESINISAIPIYYLDVNARISVYDKLSKINGEYIVNRISLPLTYNGQMSIQATKAPQRFN